MNQNWRDVEIHHYTDFVAFDGIFNGDGMRLYDLHTMDDKQEMTYYLQMLEEAVEKSLESQGKSRLIPQAKQLFETQRTQRRGSTVFAMCFSLNGDDAAQWQRYGGCARGVCIGFDAERFHKLTSQKTILQQVYYKEDAEQLEDVDVLLQALEDAPPAADSPSWKNLFDRIYLRSIAFKHPSFSSEQEVRLVTLTSMGGNVHGFESKNYRITEDRIKGYYSLDLKALCREAGLPLENLIRQIVIGPKSAQTLEVFQDYLIESGLKCLKDKVRRSDCPLR